MIYDCFTFFNEVELLKFRIEYLKNAVDHFVIVEASETHSGKPKQQNFSYDFFDEETVKKIKYYYIDFPKENLLEHLDFNADYMLQTEEGLLSWARENYQRNFIQNGLTDALENDIIILSDLDEIIPFDAIQFLKENIHFLEKSPLTALQQIPFYYSIYNPWQLDPETKSSIWLHPKVFLKRFMEAPPNIMRMGTPTGILKPGGWHFGYMGGDVRLKIKKESVATHSYEEENEKEKVLNRIDSKNQILLNIKKHSKEALQREFGLPDLIFSNKYIDFFSGGIS